MFWLLCLWPHMSALCVYLTWKLINWQHKVWYMFLFSPASIQICKILHRSSCFSTSGCISQLLVYLWLKGFKNSKPASHVCFRASSCPTSTFSQLYAPFFSDPEHIYRRFVCVWPRNFNPDLTVWYLNEKGKNRKACFFPPLLEMYISSSNYRLKILK